MGDINFSAKIPQNKTDLSLTNQSLELTQGIDKLELFTRDLLLEIVETLPSKALRLSFSQKELSTSSLMEVLKLASPETRKGFVNEMLTLALSGEEANEYVAGRLSKILKLANSEERAELVSNLICTPASEKSLLLAEKILRISPDLNFLAEVVNKVGVDTLIQLERREFTEYVATLGIGIGVREADHPPLLNPTTTGKTILARIDQLKEVLQERIELCDTYDQLAKSKAAGVQRSAAEENIKYLTREAKRCESVGELRDLTNRVIVKSAIEGIYGINLSAEKDKKGRYVRQWNMDDLEDIAKVLNAIGEGRVLFTPLLTEVSRVRKVAEEGSESEDESDEVPFAVRHFKSGRIDVSDDAIHDEFLEKKYDGVSSLQVALAHEIGHGLQLGRESNLVYDTSNDRIAGPADSLYDFGRWLEISGWIIFDSKRVQIKHDKQAALIDQKHEFALGIPVQYQGQWMIFRWDSGEKTLYAHRFNAEFSLRDYAKTSPWEDWAEAFAEYTVLPKRLATYAPQKFIYFEDQLGRFENDKEMLRVAHDSLRLKAAASQPANYDDHKAYARPGKESKVQPNPHRDQFLTSRFEALTHKEQSWILAQMLAKHEDTHGLSQIYSSYETLKKKSTDQRSRLFFRLLLDPETHAVASETFLDTKRKYLPALIAALNGIQQGDEIALLTARSSKSNNKVLVETVERFLNHSIADQYRFFPNDPVEREKVPGTNTAERKLTILKALLNDYKKVIFYDDEDKNLKAVEHYAKANRLGDRLKVIDVRKLPPDKMWESLLEKFEEKRNKSKSDTIRVFDIDGTLVNLEAKIYLIDKERGEKLRTMTQEEFSHKTEAEWIEQAKRQFPHINAGNIALDFGDFVLESRVKEQIDLQIFQRQRKRKAV